MPDDNGNGSSWWTHLPIAVGAGLSLRGLRQGIRGGAFSSVPSNTSLAPVPSAADLGVLKWGTMSRGEEFGLKSNIPAAQVIETWRQAASSVGMSKEAIDATVSQIAAGSTAQEVVQNLNVAIQSRRSSIYTQRAAGLFFENLATIDRTLAAGGVAEFVDLGIGKGRLGQLALQRTPLQLNMLDPIVRSNLEQAAGKLGAQLSVVRASRLDIPGSQLEVAFRGGKLGRTPLKVAIPEEIAGMPGVFVHGATQQSTYIAGQYGLVKGGALALDPLTHEQFVSYRVNEDLVFQVLNEKRFTRSRARQLQSAFEMSVLQAPEWIESLGAGKHLGLERYRELRAQVMRLYAPGRGTYDPVKGMFEFPKIDPNEYARILAAQEIAGPGGVFPAFPGFSPTQMSKNVISTFDPRQFYLFPEAVPFSRRPMQALRKSAAATPGALETMAGDMFQRKMKWGRWGGGADSPMLSTAFVSERYATELAKAGIGTQGGLWIARDVADMRGVNVLNQFTLATESISPQITQLLEGGKAHWNLNQVLPAGTILGKDPSGAVVSLPSEMTLLEATAFMDENRGPFVRVMANQPVNRSAWAKVFGTAKGMAATDKTQGELSAFLRTLAPGATSGINPAEAIVSMGELRKNKALFYNQLFTSLWDFTNTNMKGGKQSSSLASNFANDPLAVIAKIRKMASDGQHIQDELILREAYKIARGGGLSPQQIGLAFGAVPDVMGIESKEGWLRAMARASGIPEEQAIASPFFAQRFGLRGKEMRSMLRGIAHGAGQFFFEGLGGPGAGSRGTIEPRLLEMLDTPAWGSAGKVLKQELLNRMAMSHSNRIFEQEVLGRSLESIFGMKTVAGAIAPSAARTNRWGEAFHLQLKGMGDVYVPAFESISALSSYRTSGGEWITPQLQREYGHLIETARMYERGEMTKTGMQEVLDEMTVKLSQAKTATVVGKEGLARGGVPGSMFLTGVPGAYEEYQAVVKPGEAGITRGAFNRMISDIRPYIGEAEARALEERMKKQGYLAGAAWRHPIIDPASIQSVPIRLIEGEGDIVFFNEMERRAVLAPGQVAAEEAAMVQGAVEQGLLTRRGVRQTLIGQGYDVIDNLRLKSIMTGMGMDVDADIAAVSLVSPNVEKQLAKQITSQTQDYFVATMRQQLMSAKAQKGVEITIGEAIVDDMIKLRVPKENLGRISIGLQSARAAVLSQQKMLGKEATMNAMGLLSWLEQTPISGKHIAPGQAATMIDLFETLNKSFRQKNATMLEETVSQMLAFTSPARRAMLEEGATLFVEGAQGPLNIPALSLRETTSNIMAATSTFENMNIGGLNARRARELFFGRATPSVAEAEMMTREAGISATALQSLFRPVQPTSIRGTFAEATAKLTAFRNKAVSMGGKILPFAKPLAIGFGASIALSAIMSEPPLSISPEALSAPPPNLSGGSGGANLPQNIHPDPRTTGSPEIPPSIPPGSAHVTTNRTEGAKIRIRGTSQGRFNQQQFNNQLAYTGGRNTRISTRVSDERESLTPQRISDIIKNR